MFQIEPSHSQGPDRGPPFNYLCILAITAVQLLQHVRGITFFHNMESLMLNSSGAMPNSNENTSYYKVSLVWIVTCKCITYNCTLNQQKPHECRMHDTEHIVLHVS